MLTKITPRYLDGLRHIPYPFDTLPDDFAPEDCVLELTDSSRVPIICWCYVKRVCGTNQTRIDENSFSSKRIEAISSALVKLSAWAKFRGIRPRTIRSEFSSILLLLNWADSASCAGKFENLLGDPAVAEAALRAYNSYLRGEIRANSISPDTAANRDMHAIAALSEIHGIPLSDKLDRLGTKASGGTAAASHKDVAVFMSAMQGLFDSCSDVLSLCDQSGGFELAGHEIRVSTIRGDEIVILHSGYCVLRLMDVMCRAFAAIFIGDSGANLSVASIFQVPDDLDVQLKSKLKVGLRHKEIKIRANGKEVPVMLTVTTTSRIKRYQEVRKRLIDAVEYEEPAHFLIRAVYENGTYSPPSGVLALEDNFLASLRKRAKSLGLLLPPVTFRQLRIHKQDYHAKADGIEVAARVMGHSIATAIRNYCKATEISSRKEMGGFLSSLTERVIASESNVNHSRATIPIVPGECAEHGRPVPTDREPAVRPDCSRPEGCFFCDKFRLHADEQDLRKILSCKYVLQRIAHLSGSSSAADRIYASIVNRIDSYVDEMKVRMSTSFDAILHDVMSSGNVTRYWAVKLQQLILLGVIR